MKKRFKVLTFLIALFLMMFIGVGANSFAAEAPMDDLISHEVETYVRNGTLPSWHLDYYQDDGYQAFYYKMKYLNDNFDDFKNKTEGQIITYMSWYRSEQNQTWEYIFENLDIEPEYLEPNKYLGIYWDPYAYNNKEEGYLYLIWTSEYLPSEFVTILEFKESGKTYKLYDNQEAMDNLDMNWYDSDYYHFKDSNLTLHVTPIGGITGGKPFGIELKQKYNFQGFKFGMDQGQYYDDMDPNGYFDGECTASISFDLGLVPQQDGKNAMQLVTHAYEIIKDCEAQTHFDILKFGGWGHEVYFNTTIKIDKIYRVDVAYTLTNDNKSWWQFWLSDDDKKITKSLTPERISGGIFGLYNFQGFSEGSYQSTVDGTTNYKYKLHLNYDDEAWNFFEGKEFYEADYKRIKEFKILRMNYLVDDEVYDVAIKMDTIEGDTLFILDPDLILDTDTNYYKFKNWLDDTVASFKEKFKDALPIIYTVLGIVGGVILIWLGFKVYTLFKFLFGWIPNKKDDSGGKSSCKKKK